MIFYWFLEINIVIRKGFYLHSAAIISTSYYQATKNTLNNFLQMSTFSILNNTKKCEQVMPKENLWLKIFIPFSIFKRINCCIILQGTIFTQFTVNILWKYSIFKPCKNIIIFIVGLVVEKNRNIGILSQLQPRSPKRQRSNYNNKHIMLPGKLQQQARRLVRWSKTLQQ